MKIRRKRSRKLRFKTAVLAYQDIGYVCLRRLVSMPEVDIPFVVTHRDDSRENLWFRSVHDLAREHDIPVYFEDDMSKHDLKGILMREGPDILFSLYYRKILPEDICSIPRLGSVNLHGSFLPYYRGRCPVNWVILKGEKFTGLTFHFMVKSPDAGDIIKQVRIPISRTDTARDVYRKMTRRAPSLIESVMRAFQGGRIKPIKQDHERATYFGGRRPGDGRISWTDSAEDIHNLVRAVTHPYPGAFFHRDTGEKIYVWKTRIVGNRAYPGGRRAGAAGQVVEVSRRNGIVVRAGKRFLGCLSIQAEGAEECGGHAFAGRMNIKVGDRL